MYSCCLFYCFAAACLAKYTKHSKPHKNIWKALVKFKHLGYCQNLSSLEYDETIKQIESILTAEQQRIFFDKLQGYTLKEIAENSGIKPKRVYKQFGRIKNVVADVMESQRLYG